MLALLCGIARHAIAASADRHRGVGVTATMQASVH